MDEILQYQSESDNNEKEPLQAKRPQVIETFLYQKTLTLGQEMIEEGYELSQFLLKSLHQILLSYGREAKKSPGNFKKEQNYLVDRINNEVLFTPISPQNLPSGLDRLFKYIKDSKETPLIKTAVSHLEFEALHPFQDGNGRIGRMLITLILWKLQTISSPHFYISAYFENNKDLYIDLMRDVSQNGNWNRWILFFLKAIEKQAEENLKICNEITKLYERMKENFNSVLSSKYYLQALDFIFKNPIFKNTTFINKSTIPKATAARFTRVLANKGLITTIEAAAGRRSSLYAFEPLLRIVRI